MRRCRGLLHHGRRIGRVLNVRGAKYCGRSAMSDSHRPVGFYVRYLQRIAEQREQAGLPPSPDIAPPEYWQRRREDEATKEWPRKKAAIAGARALDVQDAVTLNNTTSRSRNFPQRRSRSASLDAFATLSTTSTSAGNGVKKSARSNHLSCSP
jgi:hypothetical protein